MSVEPAYRLLSYRAADDIGRAGVLVGERVFDAARLLDRPDYSTTRSILDDWPNAHAALAAAASSVARDLKHQVSATVADATILAPIPEPGDLFCAGANYDDHIVEMAKIMNQPLGPNMKQLGDQPWHFVKTGRSSVVGHRSDVKLPAYSKAVDWEIELVAVIGRDAKNVSVDEALDYVAGYTIANDLSARDVIQREKAAATSPFRYDWVSIKCFDGSCPLGPWIVPKEAIPDPQCLGLKLWVNDELMQDSNTSNMIFSVAEQIAMLSSRLTLRPGDLILTGTPAGVGMARRRFLRSGDRVSLWIEGIGTLTHGMI